MAKLNDHIMVESREILKEEREICVLQWEICEEAREICVLHWVDGVLGLRSVRA